MTAFTKMIWGKILKSKKCSPTIGRYPSVRHTLYDHITKVQPIYTVDIVHIFRSGPATMPAVVQLQAVMRSLL